jgi:hypothetical protein
MIAAHDAEEPSRIRKFAFFDIFDPGSIDPDRDLMFGLARDRAGVATDAFSVVDDETKVHSKLPWIVKIGLIANRKLEDIMPL